MRVDYEINTKIRVRLIVVMRTTTTMATMVVGRVSRNQGESTLALADNVTARRHVLVNADTQTDRDSKILISKYREVGRIPHPEISFFL